ncbi:hypothetical protein [Sphingobacterium sp. 2149]|uniref:hypothetical protein n=1 Tax=Sphingobacterium sp. 2149 TaxID=2817763 RepID=UPI00286556E0|nr:hypothetical protein [Sphingobacterium sp. 2149]MDR6734164.1 hypothetical protein [Sphingobacterium sp. 2149]
MAFKVEINGVDIATYGIYLAKGALNSMQQPASPKEKFYNDWKDEDGLDYDDATNLVYQSQDYDIPFFIKANGLDDYKEKKAAFVDLVSRKGQFTFKVSGWEDLKLRFKSFVNWNLVSYSVPRPSRVIVGRFILRLQNNNRNDS